VLRNLARESRLNGIYKSVTWTVQQLVDAVAKGNLRLPDLQRPFVWPATKVRDLLDSMFRGYPVGELMFWNRTADENGGSIGLGTKSHSGTQQIVDGQQRLTSLFVILTGQSVVDDEYKKKLIRISFNPFLERFEVAQPVLDRSPDWVGDVATVFASSLMAHKTFVKRYETAKGIAITEEEDQQIHDALVRLSGLTSVAFTVVEILDHVEKAVVADVFVRINSEGVNLTTADFILTWLSVFWSEGREEMEDFARDSRLTAEHITQTTGKKTRWTPLNYYLAPSPGQLVRVAVAVGQNRGRLSDAYSALRGRDRKTGMADPKRQNEELDKIKMAVPLLLNPLNWDEFMRVLAKSGFRSRKMITSNTTLLYSYSLWLIGRTRYKVDLTILRDLMARWFFMAQTTGYYTSNAAETQIQQDLDRLDGVKTADEFIAVLEGVINNSLTPDFWSIRLVDNLISSSTAASPSYQAYLASLNILNANLFMLHNSVLNWTDPSQTSIKGVEGHHLFPRAYLSDVLGYKDLKKINQVANFAPTDWHTNNIISDRPPHEYWPDLVRDRGMTGELLVAQEKWHALPPAWTTMKYEEFLSERRKLIALIIRDGYMRLTDPAYQPDLSGLHAVSESTDEPEITLLQLVSSGFLNSGDLIESIDPERPSIGEITDDGEILIEDRLYDTPTRATRALGDEISDGWDFWVVDTDTGPIPLSALKEKLVESKTA